MSKSQIGLRKAGIASIATTALVCTSVFTAGSASAVPGFSFDRIGGIDRYETSALVAEAYGDRTDVILANGEPGNFADALAANNLSGVLDAPVLLTRVNVTPDFIKNQLEKMGAEKITVVGGEARVSAEQVSALEADGYTVERISGDDRFLTNAEIIGEGGAADDNLGIIANGFGFADALAAGPVAYQGHPLGLSTADDISDGVIEALKAAGVEEVLVFGGPTAVAPSVVAKLATEGITVRERFAGNDRTETSTLAADWAKANLGFVDDAVNLATGAPTSFGADALSGGPLTGAQMRPLLLTNDANNPRDVLRWIEENNDTLVEGIIFGGNAAISVQLQERLEAAAQGEETDPADEEAPALSGATAQAEGDTVSGSVTVTDNVGVESVTAVLLGEDGEPVEGVEAQDVTDSASEDGTYSVSFGELAPGTYSIEFTAADAAGNSDSATTEPVVVEPEVDPVDEEAPVLTGATAQAEDNTVSGSVTVVDNVGVESVTAVLLGEDGEPVEGVEAQDVTDSASEDGTYSASFGELAPGTYSIEFTAEDAAGNSDSAETNQVVVNPDSNQSYTVEGGGELVDENDSVDYTVSGLEPGQTYTIQLADAGDVTVDEFGVATFRDEDEDGQADFSDVDATITEADGVVIPTGSAGSSYTGVAGEDGTVTFTVTGGDSTENIVPVVYAGADNGLDVDEAGQPTEDFGVGDATEFATISGLEVTPETAERPFGGQHTVRAQLMTADGDYARAGEDVVFEVFRGDDTNTPAVTETVQTDADGVATFTYTGPTDPNAAESGDAIRDRIVATHTASGNDGESTVDWIDAAGTAEDVTVTPAGTTADDPEVNLVGTTQRVQAVVTDRFGDPVAGETVTFNVEGANDTATVTRTTNQNGVAAFTYRGDNAGNDQVIVSHGDDFEETVHVQWSEGVATVNGVDYSSIQEALDAADEDDTITAVGSFTETVTISTQGVTLQGDGAELTGGFVVNDDADNATITGFDVTVTADSPQGRGVVTQGAGSEGTDGLSVVDNTFTNDGGIGGVFLQLADDASVEGNTFEGFTAGVSTDTNGDVTITGNTFANNDEGVGVGGLNVSITGNTFTTDDLSNHYVATYVPLPNSYLDAVLANNEFDPEAERVGNQIRPVQPPAN